MAESEMQMPNPGPSVSEGRSAIDTPISETEMENFDKFYRDFLGKKIEDKLSLLKALTLMRRGDLRPYVQYAVLFQKRYENLITPKQRDLLLSFPSANKEIYNLIFACLQSYGIGGETAVLLTKDQVIDHLDRTDMFRVDIDSLLGRVVAIVPDNKEALSQYFYEMRKLPSERTFKFTIVIMADHAFLSVMPSKERNSTIAIGQIRSYLESEFGQERFEENLIEFFVAGGGFIRYEKGRVLIGGRSAVFDPVFAEPDHPMSQYYYSQYMEHKFLLAQQILTSEFPEYEIVVNHGQTGQIQP